MNSGPSKLDLAFSALADETRRTILARLIHGELSVMELAAPFAMTQPAVTKHLNVLERAGLISRTKVGRRHQCRAELKAVAEVTGWLDSYKRALSANFHRLDRVLEEIQKEEEKRMRMIETPKVVETQPVRIARLRAKVPTREIQTQMGALLRELSDELQKQGIRPTGPWFTHHFQRPGEFFDFELCFPVEKDITPSGRVESGVWPAMKMAQTVYTGPYDGLPKAWGEFIGWIDAEGLNVSPEIWERYLVGPDSESGPNKWRTEMNRPLL